MAGLCRIRKAYVPTPDTVSDSQENASIPALQHSDFRAAFMDYEKGSAMRPQGLGIVIEGRPVHSLGRKVAGLVNHWCQDRG